MNDGDDEIALDRRKLLGLAGRAVPVSPRRRSRPMTGRPMQPVPPRAERFVFSRTPKRSS